MDKNGAAAIAAMSVFAAVAAIVQQKLRQSWQGLEEIPQLVASPDWWLGDAMDSDGPLAYGRITAF